MALDFGAMGDLIKQAQEMKKKVEDLQADLARRTVAASAGGGMVTATANGVPELVSIKFDKEIINPEDPDMLADLVVAAVNEALKKAQNMISKEMNQLTGGLNLPGIFGR